MMEQMARSMNLTFKPVVSDRRPGDSPQLISSIKKIEEELGWKPRATLKEMIDSSWIAEQANR